MAIKTVIFDLDGTITQPYFDFDAIREEMGLNRDAGPIWEAMEKMEPLQRKHAEKILHFYEQKAVAKASLNPSAEDTLNSLRKAGIKTGILTRNRKENAFAVLEKFGLEFDAVVGREDGPVKPDAFGILHICAEFGVRPTDALMVGDYLFDLLCAKKAGAKAVLLNNHANSSEFAEHADFVIDSISQILQIVKNMKE